MSFPQLDTSRFSLQQILPGDQSFIFQGLSNPEVIPYYGVQYDSYESTKAQMDWYAEIWKEKTGCWWKIVEKQSGLPAGACGINYYSSKHEKAEIGYWLLPEYWRKGIMKEVLVVVIEHLFTTWRLHRIEAIIEAGNESSKMISEKLGFRFEGEMRDSEIKNGKRISLLMYSLLKTDNMRTD